MTIEFFFDFSCPYAYLGFTQMKAIAAEARASLSYEPMLLGGVFKATGSAQNLAQRQPPSKNAHARRDMQRWARHFGVPLSMPARHPMKTVRALRALLALPRENWETFITRCFRAYWVEERLMDEASTIEAIAKEARLDDELVARAVAANDDQRIKDELRSRTNRAIERGIFGAPTIFVHGAKWPDASAREPEFFWGQDRLHMVKLALGTTPNSSSAKVEPAVRNKRSTELTVDFWFDLSSPFAYLGSTQIEGVATRLGATLRWRPFLLGALFRDVGTADVPLLTMSTSKRNYMTRDLRHWAKFWQVDFRFAPHFPLRSVDPLRVLLAHEGPVAPLVHSLFRAAWSEGKNIGDRNVLATHLAGEGFDVERLIAACNHPAIKTKLRENTQEAKDAGVFGVPTIIVSDGSRTELYWGQDRLTLLESEWAGPIRDDPAP